MKHLIRSILILAASAALGAQGGELRMAPSDVKWPAPAAGGVGSSGEIGRAHV